MQDLNPAPFRGDAKIAHVSEDFFKMCFVGANVRHATPPTPLLGGKIASLYPARNIKQQCSLFFDAHYSTDDTRCM